MLRTFLKNIYESSNFGYAIINPFFKMYKYLKYDLKSDEKTIKQKFKNNFGRELNLENPQTLNEKINWLKLNDRDPLHTKCADKFAVRDYINSKIGKEYLIPLLYDTENPKELIPENLPEIPFIIKTNHDSGGVFMVRDKFKLDYKKVQLDFKRYLNSNYYQESKEWQYKNIKPRILVEKLLLDEEGKIPFDYKLHCFNGSVRMIQVDMGRDTEDHYRNWYNPKWQLEPYNKGKGKLTEPSDIEVPKPSTLKEMLRLSEILSEPFDYVRVDWYDIGSKLYFGELTFYPAGGTTPFKPEKWDYILGEELKIRALND